MPQRQARSAAKRLEFPPDVAILKYVGSVGSRDSCFLRRRRSHPGEIHRGSDRTQAAINYKRRPLAQLRRVGKRLPDFFRRMAQFADENQRPLVFVWFPVFLYPRPAGGTRGVVLEIGHLLILLFSFELSHSSQKRV